MVLETCEISGVDLEEEWEKERREEPDLKPEFLHYHDEGCEYARACLECPFPQCLYDKPRGGLRWQKKARDKQIKRLFKKGKKVKELAAIFGFSQRTIQRALGSKKLSAKN